MAQAEQLGDDTGPAASAMRDRIREQFTERYDEHAAVQAELDALTADAGPAASDPALLDELPYAPGLLNEAPAALREALYAAFDIQCLYRHDQGQVTIWATVTAISVPRARLPGCRASRRRGCGFSAGLSAGRETSRWSPVSAAS